MIVENIINRITAKPNASVADADDFAELYREHTHAVFNYILFRVGDRAIAENLTADTFERAWEARHRYRSDRAGFTTWLFTIARRVVIDWQRQQSRRPTVELDERQPARDPLPEAQVVETERHARLQRLVRAQEESEQALIALKFGTGMTISVDVSVAASTDAPVTHNSPCEIQLRVKPIEEPAIERAGWWRGRGRHASRNEEGNDGPGKQDESKRRQFSTPARAKVRVNANEIFPHPTNGLEGMMVP